MTKACTSVVVPNSRRMMVTVHSAMKPRGGSAPLTLAGPVSEETPGSGTLSATTAFVRSTLSIVAANTGILKTLGATSYLNEFTGTSDRGWALKMDQELKPYLDGKFAALDGSSVEVGGRFIEHFDRRMDAFEGRMKDFIQQLTQEAGTRIIAAFQNVARTSDMRTRQAIADTGLLGERMLNVEDRISALERERPR
jgi:hypothetical protein